MKKIANADLGRLTMDDFACAEKMAVVVVLDNVRSLNNIGSFFRTCDAFAVESIYLCGITATPPNKDIHKTALGAELTVPWHYCATTLEATQQLEKQQYTLLAIEQVEGAVMLHAFEAEHGRKYALVFGNEVNGVDQAIVDRCAGALEIPQAGTKHSLNVSVSGGAVLWEFFKQLTPKSQRE